MSPPLPSANWSSRPLSPSNAPWRRDERQRDADHRAQIRLLNTRRDRRTLPPHPDPHPHGEGDLGLRDGILPQSSTFQTPSAPPEAAPLFSLSRRERAGVRGKESSLQSAWPKPDMCSRSPMPCIYVSRFTFHASRTTFHVSRLTHHGLRFTFYALRCPPCPAGKKSPSPES